MAADKTAKFGINLEGNTAKVSAEMASEMESLRRKIQGSQTAVKQMQGTLRGLRGTSNEVKSAKEELKAKIDQERASISSANLALLKHGTTFDKLTAQMAAAKKGPDELKERFEMLAKAGGILAGVLATVAAAAVTGVVAFGKWVLEATNAARSAQLMREAFLGSEKNATNLGTQVEALARKLATPKDKLNELAVQLTRTRLSGQAQVDTLNAVGQAAAAMGDDVGKTFQDIITRGQMWNRFRLNPLELQGTGTTFQDVAAELAKQMGVGVKEAQAALFEGRVKLEDGAKALRTALEKRFGEVNLRKMLDLNVIAEKTKERLGELTAGVKIEPLLRGFADLAKLLDTSSVAGSTLKGLVTLIGNGMVKAMGVALPIVKQFFKGMLIGALDVAIAFLQLRNRFRDTFGDVSILKNIDMVKAGMWAVKAAVVGVAAVMGLAAAATVVLVGPFVAMAAAGVALWTALNKVVDFINGIDWSALGSSIVTGLADGIKNGAGAVVDEVKGLASKVKGAFTGALDMHSPSKVFAKYGEQTTAGYAEGIEGSSDNGQRAVEEMAPGAPKARGAGAGGGGAVVNVSFAVNVTGGGNGQQIAQQVRSPEVLGALLKTIEEALLSAGIATQTPVSP